MAKLVTVAFLLMTLPNVRAGLEQRPALQAATRDGPAVATVTFTMNLRNSNPSYYSVAVTSMGSATYQSTPHSDQRTGVPYFVEFPVSSATRTKIFRFTQDLNLFQGKFKLSQSGVASTGTKSLTFTDGSINNQITYASSKNRLIRKLTSLFENISRTLEFGRALQTFRKSKPSGLTTELKRMERIARRGRLVEFQAIAPSVRQIASDATVSESSRRYAETILKDTNSLRK
jgi:hypothetical protein